MLEFLKNALDTNNPTSFGRMFCIPTLATACFSVIYLGVTNHHAPDATIIAALGGFAVAPYAVTKTGETFQKFSGDRDGDRSK